MTTQMPTGFETAIFGMGCFWGAERLLWQLEGVTSTAVGYAGGHTTNPIPKIAVSNPVGICVVILSG